MRRSHIVTMAGIRFKFPPFGADFMRLADAWISGTVGRTDDAGINPRHGQAH